MRSIRTLYKGRDLAWEIEHGFLHDIHDNLKEDTISSSTIESPQTATQTSGGSSSTTLGGGYNQASDNAVINASQTINETDPGILAAFEAFSAENAGVATEAEQQSGAALASAAHLAETALNQAGEQAKSPVQQWAPIIIGAIAVAGIYFFTKDRK